MADSGGTAGEEKGPAAAMHAASGAEAARFDGMASGAATALAAALVRRPGRLGPRDVARALLEVPGLRRQLLCAAACYSLKAVLTMLAPVSIYLLLRWFSGPEPDGFSAAGLWFALMNGACVLGQYRLHKAYCIFGAQAGRLCQAGTSAVLYRRMLQLGVADLGRYQTGELVNLVSTDSQHIAEFWVSAIFVALQPLEIAAVISLLWLIVAEATLAALAVCALSYCSIQVFSKIVDKHLAKKSAYADERLKWLSEVLYGIKVVKANGWALRFEQRIKGVAAKESRHMLRKKQWLSQVLLMTSEIVDLLAFAVAMVAILVCGQEPDASRLFTMWVFMGVLHSRLFAFPEAFRKVCLALLSFERCARFLDGLRADARGSAGHRGAAEALAGGGAAAEGASGRLPLQIRGGSFSYAAAAPGAAAPGGEAEAVLADVHLEFQPGSLYGVVGAVGAGKTSLLLGILGEMRQAEGTQVTWGTGMDTVAYVPQDPVIFNETVRDNICFGRPFDVEWYGSVCRACALEEDIRNWTGGDLTLIGSRGINISGGQQSRICLARAVYARADVYLLDDPLAKLDGRVAAEVMAQAIVGLLGKTTRIMTTNSGMVVNNVDAVVRIENGTATLETDRSAVRLAGDAPGAEPEPAVDLHALLAAAEEEGEPVDGLFALGGKAGPPPGGLRFFLRHFAAGLGSYPRAALYFVMMLVEALVIEWAVSILAQWSDDPKEERQTNEWYGMMYGIFIGLEFLIAQVKFLLMAYFAQRAWDQLHSRLLARVMRASLLWLQGVPVGHMLQLFSGTLSRIEERVFNCSEIFLLSLIFLCLTSGITSYLFPPFIAVIVFLGGVLACILRSLRGAARDARPLEASLRRSTLGLFAETLSGLVVVRAFPEAASGYQTRFEALLDRRAAAEATCSATETSLLYRLSLVGGFGYACAGFAIVTAKHVGGMTPGECGFMLTNACFFTVTLTELVIQSIALMDVAREREVIFRLLATVPQEQAADRTTDPKALPAGPWPSSGHVVIQALEVRYKPELPPAIRGLSLDVRGGEHLGVVGRTGSGKSSLLLAMCRLVEASAGSVVIDGVDIAKLGLQELRPHLGVLSQDPLFFSGSLRENLDPFGECTDEALWAALEGVGVAELFRGGGQKGQPQGLEAVVAELGGNFSVGQRQLLCLARAALRHPRVVLVDEATAALDARADERVQLVLHDRFTTAGATILQVAHRLWSLARSDRVAVLERGELAELGSPHELLVQEPPRGGRRFREMVAAMGEQAAAEFRAVVAAAAGQPPPPPPPPRSPEVSEARMRL